MTLKDAEKTVQDYGAVLARGHTDDGPASFASRLPCSSERIIQAMKLWLANDIKNRSLTEKFNNEIGSAASRLPYFIEDEEARRLNTIKSNCSAAECAGLTTEEFIKRIKTVREVDDWIQNAMTTGLSLRCALSDFIAIVEQFDPNDSLYWQRVYTLANLEYLVTKKRSFWDFFHEDS